MANDFIKTMQDFEESVVKAGLPEPPKLSQFLHREFVYPEAVEEDREDSVKTVDRLEITPQTKPGWYRVAGKQFYLSQADIPTTTPIEAGKKRGTVKPPESKLRWVMIPPFQGPPEPERTVITGFKSLDMSKLPRHSLPSGRNGKGVVD